MTLDIVSRQLSTTTVKCVNRVRGIGDLIFAQALIVRQRQYLFALSLSNREIAPLVALVLGGGVQMKRRTVVNE